MHTQNLQAKNANGSQNCETNKNIRMSKRQSSECNIQFKTSSSSGNCLKCRLNFFCCPLLRILRFFSVEIPSVDLLVIDFTELEFDDKFGGCKWSCVGGWVFHAVAVAGSFGIIFVFEAIDLGTAPSDWYCILFRRTTKKNTKIKFNFTKLLSFRNWKRTVTLQRYINIPINNEYLLTHNIRQLVRHIARFMRLD